MEIFMDLFGVALSYWDRKYCWQVIFSQKLIDFLMAWIEFTDGSYVCHSNLSFIVQKLQVMGIFLRGTYTDIDLNMTNPSDSAWFSRALQEICHHKAGKKNKLKNCATSNLFKNNNLIKMENNLKIVTITCCANSFLRIQSFQIYNRQSTRIEILLWKIFEWHAAIIQSFWNKNEMSSRELSINLTKN